MTAVQWYHARGTEQFGPVSAGELKQLAQSGRLKPDDLVWREGMADWAPARTVRGLFDADVVAPPKAAGPAAPGGDSDAGAAASSARSDQPGPAGRAPAATPPGEPDATASREWRTSGDAPPTDLAAPDARWSAAQSHVGSLAIGALRSAIPAEAVVLACRAFATVGHYALYAAMLAALLFGALLTIKSRAPAPQAESLVTAVLFLAFQYAARRLFEPLGRLAGSSVPVAIPAALAHSAAWLSLLAGPLVLLASIAGAVASGEYLLPLGGVSGMIVCGFLAAVALHPEALGLEVRPAARIEEEALGAAWFLLKIAARTVHVVFGAGIVVGVLVLAYACIELLVVENWPVAAIRAAVAQWSLLVLAALPLAAYLVLLAGVLLISVARAALDLPAKRLDAAGSTPARTDTAR